MKWKFVCFLLGESPASEFYMLTFRNTLFHLHRQVGACILHAPTCLWRWNRQSVPKRQHIKFRRQGITQKKAYNIPDREKVWNQEMEVYFNVITLSKIMPHSTYLCEIF